MELDLSDRVVERLRCDTCRQAFDRVTIFVTRDGGAFAVVRGECHAHPTNEVWLTATLGSWIEPYADHVTMSCRVWSDGAGLVDSMAQIGGAAHLGQRLTRSQALEESRLAVFWPLVDQVVTTVPEVARHIYGPEGFRPAE